MKSTRAGYGDALLALGDKREEIVVLEADLSKSTYSVKFREQHPTRFVQCGVAEQNMMGVAAGLAVSGKICYTGSFAVFASQRALEQVRNTICYNELNVKICPSHAGISVGEDGASHQTVEDIAIMRSLPGIKIIVPADYYEAKSSVIKAAEIDGPFYIRMGRPALSFVFDENYEFELGKAVRLKEGNDVSIFCCGIMVQEALKAWEDLKKMGINAEIFNVSTIKPLDETAIINSAKKTKKVVTVEEHSVIGGLGSVISELLIQKYPVQLTMVGIKDEFGLSGSIKDLMLHYHLTNNDIVKAVKSIC